MGGKSSRDKGARGEREIIKIFNDELGVDLKRNLDQYQGTDCDCRFEGMAIEIKFQETLNIGSWWKQVVAVRGNDIPVLIYRQSRKPWKVIVPLLFVTDMFVYWEQSQPLVKEDAFDLHSTIEMNIGLFINIIREVMSNNALAEMSVSTSTH